MANYALPISDNLGELLQSQGAPVLHLESSFLPIAPYSCSALTSDNDKHSMRLEVPILAEEPLATKQSESPTVAPTRSEISLDDLRHHIASVILESRCAFELRHLAEAYDILNIEARIDEARVAGTTDFSKL